MSFEKINRAAIIVEYQAKNDQTAWLRLCRARDYVAFVMLGFNYFISLQFKVISVISKKLK